MNDTPRSEIPSTTATLYALFLFVVLDLGFRLLSFERVYGWIVGRASRSVTEPKGPEVQLETVHRTFAAVRRATRFYFRRRQDCLPRALVTYYLLKRRGIAASLIFGVKKYPFGGHTWVEALDIVLDESPSRVRAYTPIKRVA